MVSDQAFPQASELQVTDTPAPPRPAPPRPARPGSAQLSSQLSPKPAPSRSVAHQGGTLPASPASLSLSLSQPQRQPHPTCPCSLPTWPSPGLSPGPPTRVTPSASGPTCPSPYSATPYSSKVQPSSPPPRRHRLSATRHDATQHNTQALTRPRWQAGRRKEEQDMRLRLVRCVCPASGPLVPPLPSRRL